MPDLLPAANLQDVEALMEGGEVEGKLGLTSFEGEGLPPGEATGEVKQGYLYSPGVQGTEIEGEPVLDGIGVSLHEELLMHIGYLGVVNRAVVVDFLDPVGDHARGLRVHKGKGLLPSVGIGIAKAPQKLESGTIRRTLNRKVGDGSAGGYLPVYLHFGAGALGCDLGPNLSDRTCRFVA